MKVLLELLYAALGSCGFALLFKIRGYKVLYCSICGAVVWGVYLLLETLGVHYLLANFCAAAVAALLSECLARLLKSPATVFNAPAVIPLIPGGSLFSSMEALLQGNTNRAWQYGTQTIAIAIVIAVGIYIGLVVCRLIVSHSVKAH